MEELTPILQAFSIEEVQQIQPIVVGLIHQTYKVTSSKGTYSLQGLHPKLATDGIMADYEVVNRALQERKIPAPQLVFTTSKKSFFEDATGKRWRLTTWLEGRCVEAPQNLTMVRSAAALVGQFHAKMSDLKYDFQSTHPLHKTAYHLQRLQEASEAHQDTEFWGDIKEIASQVPKAIEPLLLPAELPRGVVHGDPKISNVLFDQADQAIALIDLDTCNRHSVLVDVGDAVRSWCREGGEDQMRPFSLDRYKALIEGYASAYPNLSQAEREHLPHAGRLITLELTSRFLTDYLEDAYFGWDSQKYPSRRAHNLARAQSMWALAKEMEEQVDAMTQIVEAAFAPTE